MHFMTLHMDEDPPCLEQGLKGNTHAVWASLRTGRVLVVSGHWAARRRYQVF